MGFFDILKKKPTHEEKLNEAYNLLKNNFRGPFFLYGLEQADTIVNSISKILNLNLLSLSGKDYYNLLYMDLHIMREPTHSVYVYLLLNNYVRNEENADKIYAFSILNSINPNFELNSLESFETLNSYVEKIKINKSNKTMIFDNQRTDSDDYGFSTENPLCSSSFRDSYYFLLKLMTENNEELYWKMNNSLFVPLCNGTSNIMIDEFQLYLNGNEYKKIYICPYTKESETLPKGLKLNDSVDYSRDISRESAKRGISIERLLEIQRIEPTNLYEALLKI